MSQDFHPHNRCHVLGGCLVPGFLACFQAFLCSVEQARCLILDSLYLFGQFFFIVHSMLCFSCQLWLKLICDSICRRSRWTNLSPTINQVISFFLNMALLVPRMSNMFDPTMMMNADDPMFADQITEFIKGCAGFATGATVAVMLRLFARWNHSKKMSSDDIAITLSLLPLWALSGIGIESEWKLPVPYLSNKSSRSSWWSRKEGPLPHRSRRSSVLPFSLCCFHLVCTVHHSCKAQHIVTLSKNIYGN